MNRTRWHKGPPPSVGWWPASQFRTTGLYRWWDGVCWSKCAGKRDSEQTAARLASIPARDSSRIEWHDRPKGWPPQSYT